MIAVCDFRHDDLGNRATASPTCILLAVPSTNNTKRISLAEVNSTSVGNGALPARTRDAPLRRFLRRPIPPRSDRPAAVAERRQSDFGVNASDADQRVILTAPDFQPMFMGGCDLLVQTRTVSVLARGRPNARSGSRLDHRSRSRDGRSQSVVASPVGLCRGGNPDRRWLTFLRQDVG